MLRCVQVLRRLMVRNKDVGVFCNVSAATLGNPDQFRAMPRLPRGQPRAGAVLRARIQAGDVPQSRPDRDRASRRAVAARLPLLDRSRHRSCGSSRANSPTAASASSRCRRRCCSIPGRPRPPTSIPPTFRSARPLRHRPDRREDRGRTRRGRPARLRRAGSARASCLPRRGRCGPRGHLLPAGRRRTRTQATPMAPAIRVPVDDPAVEPACGRPAMPRWRGAPPDRANRPPDS